MKSIKTITVKDKVYTYIQENTKSSVDGVTLKIDPSNRDVIKSSTGYYKDLIQPLFKDDSISQVNVLSITVKGMAKLTGFFFVSKETEVTYTLSKDPNIAEHFKKYMESKGIECESINSLEFMAEDEFSYSILMNYYYNPKSVDDTGIEIKNEIVPYGSTLIIENVQSIVNQYENLKQGKLGALQVSKIELKLYDDGPQLMSSIGSGKLFKENGDVVSSFEYFSAEEIAEQKLNAEEYKKECQMDALISYAYNANEQIDQRPHRKNEIIEDCVIMYEREILEDNLPYYESIGVNFLLECIKNNLVKMKNKTGDE